MPELILRPYQREAVAWMIAPEPKLDGATHKYVAHDPGLGKTITTIGALKELNAKTALIICPPKIKEHGWRRALVDQNFCKDNEIGIITSQLFNETWKRPYVIIGWQMACKPIPHAYLYDRRFEVVTLDEARALKSLTSQTSAKFLGRKKGLLTSPANMFSRKFLLDGTPMPNRPIELFPPAKVLAEKLLGRFKDYNAYGEYFCTADELRERGEIDDTYSGCSKLNLPKLKKLLDPFLHVLRIEDVYDLPPILFNDIFVDIGQMEDVDETNTPQAKLRQWVGLQKVPIAIEIAKEKIETLAIDQKRLLIYTHHREVNKQLCNALDGIQLIGGMTDLYRETALSVFKHPNNRRPLIANIKAAGDAIDGLQHVCCDVLKVEMDWSAGSNNQAVGRIKRVGQERPMTVTRIVALDTLDEAVLGVHHQKNARIKTLSQRGLGMFERLLELLERIADALEDGGNETVADPKPKATGRPSKPKDAAPPATAAPATNAPTGTPNTLTVDDARAKGVALHAALGGGPDNEKPATDITKGELNKVGANKYAELTAATIPTFCAAMDAHIAKASTKAAGLGDL